MKPPVYIPVITTHFVPICKRKKYVRVAAEVSHARPS